ncbi:kinesin [Niveomyces insectorum RCEF 264]|uniref:Kinesin n=1 Tax=Niveomyces insectorum RCEF 264 TaxID=1081102 RepID=A0A167VQJ4_9HYPO|nr:kinesin [Niveomyces insectorum RCEF 264]
MVPSDPGASSIVVAVRVRPFTIREAAQLTKNDDGTLFLGDGSLAAAPAPKLNQRGLRSVIKVVDDRCLVFDPPEDNPVQKFSRSVVPAAGKKVKDQVFAFDRIFDDNATQMDVYEGTTKNLLDSVLDGYNATVFAYGATGCGKTHTITGTAQQPGIIFLTMQELFEKINERSDDKITELTLSYLEIYNETIRDLLVPGGSKQGLMLREDTNQAVTVAGLTSHHPRDVQEVMDMIVQGNEYRTVSPTEANAVSSRSHAVLQINVAQRDRNANVNEPHTMATLSIIDLAGSERASATKNRGERLLEGANINKSLLALGGCINALCDPRKKNHVPYRNSKLTRLLKFSLGGNCKTVMIVCVSPSSAHFDETQNTLRYANRAKNIQTKVTRNVFNVNRHVKDFLVKIDEQMALINELKAQQRDAEAAFGVKVRKQLDKRDATTREGIQRIRVAYENALPEREQKVADMKKLRCVERRIATLSAWASAFDTSTENGGGNMNDSNGEDSSALAPERAMPPPMVAMRKTVRGILAELEHSRHHLHQKIERSNWERPVDSALQHSITQVASFSTENATLANVVDPSEAVAGLTREAERLKANFAREAYLEVLEQEKTNNGQNDTALLQTLLLAQFEALSLLAGTQSMGREEAMLHGQRLISRLMETGVSAASQVVKPDPSFSASLSGSTSAHAPAISTEMFPPSRRGTPRRKKVSSIGAFSARPSMGGMGPQPQQHAVVSPTKTSPRRRKMMMGPARKVGSVSFTPVKKKSATTGANRRSVRWRDDETEAGTLADFEKTPQRLKVKEVIVEEPEEAHEPGHTSQQEEPQEQQPPKFQEDKEPAPPEPLQLPLQQAPWSTMETVPEETQSPSSPELPPPPPVSLPGYLNRTDWSEDESSSPGSLLVPPPEPSLPGISTNAAQVTVSKPSRFQAGFLSKARVARQGSPTNGSALAVHPGGGSSDTESAGSRRSTPLRNLSLCRASGNQLSPSMSASYSGTRIASLSGTSPKTSLGRASTPADENRPPSQIPERRRSTSPQTSLSMLSSSANSDSEVMSAFPSSMLDAQKLRSALHSAKNASAGGGGLGAASTLANSAGARRFSVGGPHHLHNNSNHHHHHHRASASYSGPAVLASSANGISRQRRRSAERRRSPPLSCSPFSFSDSSGSGSGGSLRDGAVSRALTPGQARRMDMGAGRSRRWESSAGGSPGERDRGRNRLTSLPDETAGSGGAGSKARRITVGSAAMVGLNSNTATNKDDTTLTSVRSSVTWR